VEMKRVERPDGGSAKVRTRNNATDLRYIAPGISLTPMGRGVNTR
jgi:hypothetical protein